MAVVVEVADDGHAAADGFEHVPDPRDLGGRFLGVDRDPDQFRTGRRQLLDLLGGSRGVSGVGIGHRLHDHRGAAAHR